MNPQNWIGIKLYFASSNVNMVLQALLEITQFSLKKKLFIPTYYSWNGLCSVFLDYPARTGTAVLL